MPVRYALIVSIPLLCLCGCPQGIPIGLPSDHYRPHGHQDTTLDVSPTDDAIVFNATGAGGRDLYLLQLESLRVTRIAETPEYEVWPSFSADGKNLVYAAGIPGDRADHVFKRGVDGGAAEQLTHADANDSSPRFSSDGTTIVFARNKTYNWGGQAANWGSDSVICLVQSDGTNERQLTADGNFAFEPRFSVDGKSVMFSTATGLASVPVDGSASPKPIPGPSGAVPSSDAKLLAYSKGQYSPDYKLYVADSDGSSERLLTPNIGGCSQPIFSRAGNRLFFFREEWPDGPTGTPRFNIWEAAIDGKTTQLLTDYHLFDNPLSWKPKGQP